MMNRDEALRAQQIGQRHMQQGNYAKAVKFLEKSQSMFDSAQTRELLAKAKRGPEPAAANATGARRRPAAAAPASASSTASRKPAVTEPPKDTRPYTAEQLRIVQEITRCKELYAMLGLSRGASAAELKKAYRKKAVKVHPDKNSAPGADEAFKSINRAFSILSDDQKRAEYDQYGETSDNPAQYARRYHHDDFDPTDIFREVFGAQFGASMGGPGVRMYNFGPGGMHRHGPRGGPGGGPAGGNSLMQFLPLLLLFLMSFVTLPMQQESVFSLRPTQKFPRVLSTHEFDIYPDISFYVSQSTAREWARNPTLRRETEKEVQTAYVADLSQKCDTDKKKYRSNRNRGNGDPKSCIDLQKCEEFVAHQRSLRALFSFHQSSRYPILHKTLEPDVFKNIEFFVPHHVHKSWKTNPETRKQVERRVQKVYERNLDETCFLSQMQRRYRDPSSCGLLKKIRKFNEEQLTKFSSQATFEYPLRRVTREPDVFKGLEFFVSEDTNRQWSTDVKLRKKVEGEVQRAWEMQGAAMFVDISNFSALGDKLCADDVRGPEQLVKFLNGWLALVVRLVNKAGGDIVSFAGDAVIVLWPVMSASSPDTAGPESSSLTVAVQRAVQSALDIQTTIFSRTFEEIDLECGLKVGIGAGHVSLLHVGGTRQYRVRNYTAVGAAVRQAFCAEKLARPKGDVICSAAALRSGIDNYFAWDDLDDGEFARIKDQTVRIRMRKQTRLQLPQRRRLSRPEVLATLDPRQIRRAARLYLPPSLFAYDEPLSRVSAKDWISELRQVTILFVHLGFKAQDFDQGLSDRQLEWLNEAVYELQEAIMDYEGSLNKLNLDDKGLTAMAVFGLAPLAHENDATRAVLTALRIVSVLEAEFRLKPSIGITSSLCYCGVVGHTASRREFSVIGDGVNLAARLMQSAKTNSRVRVLTDAGTRTLVRDEVEFSTNERDIRVKGKMKKIRVYSPSRAGRINVVSRWSAISVRISTTVANSTTTGVGPPPRRVRRDRGQEDAEDSAPWDDPSSVGHGPPAASWQQEWRSQVARYGTRVVEDLRSLRIKLIHAGAVDTTGEDSLGDFLSESSRTAHAVTVITGEIGMGKSHMLARIHRARTSSRGAFAIWIDLIHPMLDAADRRGCIHRWLRLAGSRLTDHEALVADLFLGPTDRLPFQRRGDRDTDDEDDEHADDESDSDSVVHMPGQSEGASDLIAELLVDVLRGVLMSRQNGKAASLVCLVDDAHHMDDDSWMVVEHIVRHQPRAIFLVMAMTAMHTSVPTPTRLFSPRGLPSALRRSSMRAKLLENPRVHVVRLAPLGYAAVATMLRARLNVLSVPDNLVDILTLASLGNPLFVEEILQEMLDSKAIDVDEASRTCQWRRRPPKSVTDLFARYERFVRHEFVTRDSAHSHRQQRSAAVVAGLKLDPPASLVCVVGAWLNGLTLRQQVLLKIASHAVEANKYLHFHRKLVIGAMLLIDTSASIDDVVEDFELLEKAGFVELAGDDSLHMFSFVHWLMPHAMRLRTLASQRQEIASKFALAEENHDAHIRQRFLTHALDSLDGNTTIKSGFIMVQKHAASLSKNNAGGFVSSSSRNLNTSGASASAGFAGTFPQSTKSHGHHPRIHRRRSSYGSVWKRRFAKLYTNRLDLFYDESRSRRIGSIGLDANARCMDAPVVGQRSAVLRVLCYNWEKHDMQHIGEERSFFLSPCDEDPASRDDWIYKIKFAIQASTARRAAPRRSSALLQSSSSSSSNMHAPRHNDASIAPPSEIPPPPDDPPLFDFPTNLSRHRTLPVEDHGPFYEDEDEEDSDRVDLGPEWMHIELPPPPPSRASKRSPSTMLLPPPPPPPDVPPPPQPLSHLFVSR
ncbi:Adenylate cyclase type 10 [Hondaea fermentalgiana]|uniref:Adenylate cyclase type 10 n=1 Tax=Hondaea fermentalgiana TaxID=2315210 RepID=A0A2R5GKK8_9STRA|nr:Adenylate cyclase type 10 [Hondaea fermentalgiana]|eukprot:GBG31410.1 Adenylate cyclase type 10 [Hondaea fermentalgiana]